MDNSDQKLHFSQAQISVPMVAFYLLYDEPKLLSVYLKLVNIFHLGLLDRFNSKELAAELGFSKPHFTNLTKKLAKLKLLQIHRPGRTNAFNLTYPNSSEIDEQLTKFLTINQNLNNKEVATKINNLRENLIKSLEKCEVKQLTPLNIYTYNFSTNNYIHTNEGGGERPLIAFSSPPSISNSNKSNSTTKTYVSPEKPKKKQQYHRFPKIQYNQVLNAYNRISGVARKGNEMQTAWRQTRAMFLAGRKPDEIIRCMEWMEEHKDEPQFKWLKFWTMGTVQKRLPDFLAGRFTNEEEDDGLEQLN